MDDLVAWLVAGAWVFSLLLSLVWTLSDWRLYVAPLMWLFGALPVFERLLRKR